MESDKKPLLKSKRRNILMKLNLAIPQGNVIVASTCN